MIKNAIVMIHKQRQVLTRLEKTKIKGALKDVCEELGLRLVYVGFE